MNEKLQSILAVPKKRMNDRSDLAQRMAEKTDDELLEIVASPDGVLPKTLNATASEHRKREIDAAKHVLRSSQIPSLLKLQSTGETEPRTMPAPTTGEPRNKRGSAAPGKGPKRHPDSGYTNQPAFQLVPPLLGFLQAIFVVCWFFGLPTFVISLIGLISSGWYRGGVFGLSIGAALLAFPIWGLITRAKRRKALIKRLASSPANPHYTLNASELPETSMIRAVLLDKAIPASSLSLIVWGAINFAMWFGSHEELAQKLSHLRVPPEEFALYTNSGCVIGAAMLAFGFFGYATKSAMVGYLDGFVLMIVGFWNFASTPLLNSTIQSHGYKTGDSLNFWMWLGLIQICWGLAQLSRFSRFGFQHRDLSPSLKSDTLANMQNIVQALPRPSAARFKLNIRPKSLIEQILDQFVKQGTYTVWLLPEKAFCLQDQLKDYFEFDRQTIVVKQSEGKIATERCEGSHEGEVKMKVPLVGFRLTKEISLDDSAFESFNNWLRIT